MSSCSSWLLLSVIPKATSSNKSTYTRGFIDEGDDSRSVLLLKALLGSFWLSRSVFPRGPEDDVNSCISTGDPSCKREEGGVGVNLFGVMHGRISVL